MNNDNYKSGQLVMVYDFPFDSRAERIIGVENGRSKPRPAIVLGVENGVINTIPVFGIYSKEGKTEREGYALYPNEVRVPNGMLYKEENNLKGVVCVDRIEKFYEDEISTPYSDFPLRNKIEIIDRYEEIKNWQRYKDNLERYDNNHEEVMKNFKENVIAEQLEFMTSYNDGINYFESNKHQMFTIDKIQKLGKDKNENIYSVILTDGKNTYAHTLSTLKNERAIIKSWNKPKTAEQWLKEDVKFYKLYRNHDERIKPTPTPHPNKYKDFSSFRKNVLRKINSQQIER